MLPSTYRRTWKVCGAPTARYSGTLTQLKTTWLASAKKRTLPPGCEGSRSSNKGRNPRWSAGHAANRAAAELAFSAACEGQVAIGIEEYLRVGGAVEREGEGQRKSARIVIAERDHRTALRGGAGIVTELPSRRSDSAALPPGSRRESQGGAGEVELVEVSTTPSLSSIMATFPMSRLVEAAALLPEAWAAQRSCAAACRCRNMTSAGVESVVPQPRGVAARRNRRGTDAIRTTKEPEAAHREDVSYSDTESAQR